MFSCPLHGWNSHEGSCPECRVIVSSTGDSVTIGIPAFVWEGAVYPQGHQTITFQGKEFILESDVNNAVMEYAKKEAIAFMEFITDDERVKQIIYGSENPFSESNEPYPTIEQAYDIFKNQGQ